MPIYAYRCSACGHAKDVLQKLSDPLLTTCPACGAEAFTKQVTAAGLQLKGSGWYVTDFRGGNAGAKGSEGGEGNAGKPEQAQAGGEAHSAEAVRFRIKQMIDQEAADAVLSDDAIVTRLKDANIDIARRTVAKYRESLRIPSSVERRREKAALAAQPA